MATALSVNALQASVARAERQVQQDQVRVNEDASRLQDSKEQLYQDKQTLSENQRKSEQAAAAATPATPAVRLDNAIQNPPRAQQVLPAELAAAKPSVNSLGQTIGKLISVTA